jgi:hypothetical protein
MHWHENPNRDIGKAMQPCDLRWATAFAVQAVETAEISPPATLPAAD